MHGYLDTHDADLAQDLFDGIELAVSAAGANCASIIPCLLATDVGMPEGPGAALPGPQPIDGAAACFAVEEHAIAVGKLDERPPHADPPHVFPLKLVNRQSHVGGEGFDFFLVYPNITRRTGAAIAALSAFKP